MSNPPNPDSCALDAQGNLMDASEIQFYNSEGDENPITSTSAKGKSGPSTECMSLGHSHICENTIANPIVLNSRQSTK